MAKKFLTGIDLVLNQLLNAILQNLASAPSSPQLGQVYFDTTLNAVREWDGTAWTNKATDSLLLQGQNGAYYLARANQSGTQLAATISNLQATVVNYTLDTFAPPVAAVNFNGQKITSLATPTASTDGATKGYVDTVAQGLTPKPTARVATAAALPANSYSNGSAGVGATLTGTSNGALTIDSYVVVLGDVVLIKNEIATANNGLYNVTATGGAGAAYLLTRNVDMDQATEFGGGFIPVENNGATTANSLWLCNVANSITVGTTAVSFTQLNSATSYTQGNGISISGNVVTAVAAASGGVAVGSGGIALDTTIAVSKYAVSFGDGSATSYTITHNLGTRDVTVGVYAVATPYTEVECDVSHTTTNTITLAFATAPSANQYRAVVHG